MLLTTQGCVDMTGFRSLAQGSTSYEQLKVVDDMNDLWSHELGLLDFMNLSGLGKIWMILCHELKPLDVMNYLMLWRTWMTPGHELRARDAINNSGLCLTFNSWSQGSRCYEQLIVVNDMNDLVSCDLRPLDAMNRSELWMLITNLHHWLLPKSAIL